MQKQLSLPAEIFENLTPTEQIKAEGSTFYIIENVDFEDGTRVFIHGAETHQRGMAVPEVLYDTNKAKKIFIEGIKIATRWEYAIGTVLLLMKPHNRRIKALESILASFTDMAYKAMGHWILKPQFMIPTPRELRSLVSSFVRYMGIQKYHADRFGAIFSHFIEYDNAYRFRLLDLFSETTKELMVKNPRKEIKKLMNIATVRDHGNVGWKFKGIAFFIRTLLLIPSIKRAFKQAILESDFKKLQYDDNDRYWTAMRTDYPWWGLEAEERSKFNIGKKLPVPVPLHEYERLVAEQNKKQT